VERIAEHLSILRIPLAADQLDEQLRLAEQRQLSPLAFLERFLSEPARLRQERSIERRIREAAFRDAATLESFDWKFNAKSIDRLQMEELATGDFIRRRDNLVFVGQSGLGKSHLMQAIARRCCVAGYRVRYRSSAQLLQDLQSAAGEGTIDEFGFDRLERLECAQAPSLLYKVIDSRSQQASTALVTNVDFESWGDYLGDPPLAMALLDRVVDGAIIHRFQGKSYRAHRAKTVPAKRDGSSGD
jgi:DNA replication protein DnaC